MTTQSNRNGRGRTSHDNGRPVRRKDFSLLDSKAFTEKKFARRWLVNGVLVQREVGVIGGPKKCLKTSLCVDLAISIGSGEPFLGRFDVPRRRRVAVFSGETSPAAIQSLAHRVCESKSISLAKDCDVLWSHQLPQLSRPQDLSSLKKTLKSNKVRVVIIDPLYLCLLGGGAGSASNLFEVGPVLRNAAKACLDAGATPLLVHHMAKSAGRKSAKASGPVEPPDLDDLAWSGTAEFARQWLLLNRRVPHEPGGGRHELGLAVGGSAGHSANWAVTVDEGSLEEDFSGRHWTVDVTKVSEMAAADSGARISKTDRLASTLG